jgi:hypothetical protein
MTVSKARKEIAASEKAANATYKKVNPQPTAVVKDVEQELLELRRKNAALEKRIANMAGGGQRFLVESPVLHDTAKWAELNKGENAKHLRNFMMSKFLNIHSQPLLEPESGRTKHIKGGVIELIKGRGEFDSEDWARYLALNYPDYIISERKADGTYKRFAYAVPAADPRAGREDEEFYYDELPQTARTLAAANPRVQIVEAQTPTLVAAPTPTRQQAQIPQAVKDRLAAAAQETGAPEAVLTAV